MQEVTTKLKDSDVIWHVYGDDELIPYACVGVNNV